MRDGSSSLLPLAQATPAEKTPRCVGQVVDSHSESVDTAHSSRSAPTLISETLSRGGRNQTKVRLVYS